MAYYVDAMVPRLDRKIRFSRVRADKRNVRPEKFLWNNMTSEQEKEIIMLQQKFEVDFAILQQLEEK